MPNDFRDIVESLEPWRKLHARRAYKPITKAGASDERVTRFGGMPLLGPEDKWPSCGRCSRPLSLLLQLDLADLPVPDAKLGDGVLQVFYCTRMDFDAGEYCDDYAPFSECHHLRVIANGQLKPPVVAQPKYAFPTIEIVGWEAIEDYPDGEEHERLGLRYDYDFQPGRTFVGVHWDEAHVHHEPVTCTNDAEGDLAGAIASAAPKDKLLGWPMWIQGVEYPACPRCDRQMRYFFQIDSEDNLPHMFGDFGCGHVSYCPEHPDVLAFTWACS